MNELIIVATFGDSLPNLNSFVKLDEIELNIAKKLKRLAQNLE